MLTGYIFQGRIVKECIVTQTSLKCVECGVQIYVTHGDRKLKSHVYKHEPGLRQFMKTKIKPVIVHA